MRCEVCGREIHGPPYYRIIEGGKMTVCSQCSRFGTTTWDPRKPQAKPLGRRPARNAPPRRRSDIDIVESVEFVENYGTLIRKTRQRKGLNIEDFANKLREKESVIKKLEKEQSNPTMGLIRKVERELGIKILEQESVPTGTVLTKPMGARTLGDMIKIKRPKDEEEED